MTTRGESWFKLHGKAFIFGGVVVLTIIGLIVVVQSLMLGTRSTPQESDEARNAAAQFLWGTARHETMFVAMDMEYIMLDGYSMVMEGKTASATIMLNDTDEVKFYLARDNPNGMKANAIFNGYGQNLLNDGWGGNSWGFDEMGSLKDDWYIQMSACDLDGDGTKEIIVTVGNNLVDSVTAFYSLDKGTIDHSRHFYYRGFIEGQTNCIFDGTKLILPFGGQGLAEVYRYIKGEIYRKEL